MTRIKTKSNSDSKTSKRPIKENGYSSDVLKAVRAAKRAEAGDRHEKYLNLDIKSRIALAKSRRGESKRELARLQAKAA